MVRLSKCNVLLYTPYNYTFFNKNRHFEMYKYLNIALEQLVDENGSEIGKGVTDFSSRELLQALETRSSVTVINRTKMRIY